MIKQRCAVLISGNGSNLQALIDACAKPEFPVQLVRVISNNEQAYGLQRAHKAGIETLIIDHRSFHNRDDFDLALHEALIECGAQIVCLAGFMRILTADFVGKWPHKMLNIHPSLLPAYRGLHTHRRALEDGVKFAGCTVHFVVPEMDAGPIVIQAAVPILAGDTEQTLAQRVLEQEHRMYPQALRWLAEGKLTIEGNRVLTHSEPNSAAALIHPPLD